MKKICIVLFMSVLCTASFAQTAMQQKVKLLYRTLDKNHYQPIQWNDSASVLLYNKWLETMDDEKLFFTQKDIDALAAYRVRLDDEVLGKEWNFFDQSIKIYKKSLQKVDSILKVIIAKPLDINKPDNLVWPLTNYATNDIDLAQRWQKYVKWQVLENIAESVADTNGIVRTDAAIPLTKLEVDARTKVKNRELQFITMMLQSSSFATDREDDYLNAIAWCYDPHTDYMNAKSRAAFMTQMNAAEYSVGMDLNKNEKGDIAVEYLQPGGSAWRSGQIHTGDVILKVKVDNKEKAVADLSEEDLESVLHSSNASEMEVTVKAKSGETKKVLLTKEKNDNEEEIVKSYLIRGQKNIGYINLPGFYSREDEDITSEKDIKYDGCANDVSKEIVKLKKDSVAGLILDLRFNGGGSMWEAMQLAGIFIDLGPVASQKNKEGKIQFLKDPNRGTIYDGPLVVLINGSSASASEFLSAALQDHKRAVLMGSATYGKGTAQIVMPMDTGTISNNNNYIDFVKVTIAKFYRINGSTVQWQGVAPDISLPDMYDDDSYKEKANASALQPDLSKAGTYQPSAAPPIASLAAKSNARVSTSNYFKTVSSFFNWMQQTKKEKQVPLQWSAYINLYNQAMNMYKEINDAKLHTGSIQVYNNNFDAKLVEQFTNRRKEINAVYIQHVKEDAVIEEACQVLWDWSNK